MASAARDRSAAAGKAARLASPQSVMLAGLCAMALVTYVDRVNIATAAPVIRSELGLSATQLGLAFSAFAIPYGLLQPFGGWLGDRHGPRLVLGLAGLLWAAATAATGLVHSLAGLFAVRLAVGLGEGASFPAATTAMARWLPPHRRAFAQGLTHSFARIGNALTPPLVGALIVTAGWRAAFVILGGVSALWAAWWLWAFRDDPHRHPAMTEAELAELPPAHPPEAIPWGPLVRRILPVTAVDFCYGWTLWVYLTWLPSFLADRYHLGIRTFVWFTAGILLAGVVGDTVGGVLSDVILVRTGSLKVARRLNLVVGLLGSLLFLLPCLFVTDLIKVSLLLSLAFFFLELTSAVLAALPMDLAPRHAGTAGGLMTLGFGIAGVLSPSVFGFLIDTTHSWMPPLATSVALLLAGVVLALRIDPGRPWDDQTP